MTDKKSSESRRKLLKSIAAGSGAIIAGKNLPESWSRPVVDSVITSSTRYDIRSWNAFWTNTADSTARHGLNVR